MKYRHLSEQEVASLKAQSCIAQDWQEIWVSNDGFETTHINNVQFSGTVRLGSFNKVFTLYGGFQCHSGLHNVTLFNVTVEDDCCIQNVQNYIANYHIGAGTLIQNIGLLAVEGPTSFGNGVEVSVLNETGGREVVIHDQLSAQQAYMMALYRHRPLMIQKLQQMTQDYVQQVSSSEGYIGRDCQIINTQFIRNVKMGDACQIIGACRLRNGSLNSCPDAPIIVGQGCIFQDFIISSGSKLTDSVMLERVFVGQACKLGHGYMASDSLFFSNCQGENGEACAIFAGPFTVTHHKSSLLIAGMYSFMNAGSGSNQSNHMYKLGPIHQGIMERGSKTASDSYVLWPSRVGAFSLVMGRHVTHSDTTNLPFSYLIEKQNTTYLVPGVNLRSVGTIRDAQKWPKRDGRTDPNLLDCINYNLLSPFTIQKMLKGVETLNNLRHASGELSDIYSFHSTKIKNSSLMKGIQFYTTAIHKFMGNSIISRIEKAGEIKSEQQLREVLRPDTHKGEGEWIDMSGLIAPKNEVLQLIADIEEDVVTNIADINARFREMHANYYSYEWTWAYHQIESFYSIDPSTITIADVIRIIEQWKDAVIGLDRMVYDDARKEFSLASMTGFGADGNRDQKEMDFEQVRGDFESNGFVNAVLKHIETKRQLGDYIIEKLNKVGC